MQLPRSLYINTSHYASSSCLLHAKEYVEPHIVGNTDSATNTQSLAETLAPPKKPLHRYDTIAKLFNVNADQLHLLIPRKPAEVVVGRSSSCDIRLGGADVLSRHCQFSLSSNDTREYLMLTDMSSNGTFVNDEVLGRGNTVVLRSGDKVAFARSGTYVFRYLADDTAVTSRRLFFADYILLHQLGTGHYAVVREARDRTLGDVVAVKIFHPNKNGTAAAEEENKLRQEMELLLLINHPNIVRFISHYVEPTGNNASTTYLVLEKVNSGELFQRIVSKLKLAEDETRALYKQLLAGLGYLHGRNIIHRDIKPENILLDITPRRPGVLPTGPWDSTEHDVRVKIADFGLAKFIGERKFTNTLCGTPAYVAPEVLANGGHYLTKVDVWLAGVLLYVCLCGFPPFSDDLAPPSMRDQILTGKYAFYSPYWDTISDLALDLISKMLVVDPSRRLDVQSVSEHPWVEEAEMHGLRHSSVIAPTQPMTLQQRFTSELNAEQMP